MPNAQRFVSAMVLESVYGYCITSLDDPYVTLMDQAMNVTTASAEAGSSLVDLLPSCTLIRWHAHCNGLA